MRNTALVVILLVVFSLGSALAAPKPPPPPPVNGSGNTVDVAAEHPELALPNFGGAPVINWLPEGGWTGFSFAPNPAFDRPLIYAFVRKLHGVPTLDKQRAQIFADWGFACADPRVSQGQLGYGSWWRQGGIQLTNEKFIVRAVVTFFACRPATPDYDPEGLGLVRGDVVAGPFEGIGKTNAVVDWQAFFNAYSWARGLNFGFGQTEASNCKLQLKALTEAFKTLKPPAPTPLPY